MPEGESGGFLFHKLVAARPRLTALGCGLAHAVLMMLAFEPVGLWPAAFVSAVPLVWGADRLGRASCSRGWLLGLLASVGALPFWVLVSHWTVGVSPLGFIPMPLYLSVYAGLFVWIGVRLVRARPGVPLAVWAPLLWCGLEVLRGSVVFHGFPWYLVGHPLIEGPAGVFTWPARAVGAYGVSAIVVALGAAAVQVGLRRWRRWVIAGGGLVVFGLVGVVVRVLGAGGGAADPVRIALVQTNVPMSVRVGWSLDDRLEDWIEMRELMRAAASDPELDLIVLPEGMFPSYTLGRDALRAEMRLEQEIGEPLLPVSLTLEVLATQKDLGVPLLVGGPGYDGLRFGLNGDGSIDEQWDGRFNSVFLIENGVPGEERYDKMFLAPFGEIMPHFGVVPGLQDMLLGLAARGATFVYSEGDDPVAFSPESTAGAGGASGRVATPICFEATMPAVTRRLVVRGGRRRAGVIVNVTNDGWFGSWTAGRLHHLQAARWRCVELATPMARAANSGVSAFVDAWGVVVSSGTDEAPGADNRAGVLTGRVTPADWVPWSFWGGPVTAWLLAGGALACVGAGFRGRRAVEPEADG